jgi:hypothetical protein
LKSQKIGSRGRFLNRVHVENFASSKLEVHKFIHIKGYWQAKKREENGWQQVVGEAGLMYEEQNFDPSLKINYYHQK